MMSFTNNIKATIGWVIAGLLAVPSLAGAVDFTNEIQPIFEQNCLDCHGPDKSKAGLRLDRRASLLQGGDSGQPAIVPGDAGKSHLLELIKGVDPDYVMPPKGDRLTESQIASIDAWIAAGAVWPGQMDEVAKLTTDHWSFQPVRRPEVPAGSVNPIDAFLNARLKTAGIAANGRADAHSLVRRASIILTGLPPTPERVEQFVEASKQDGDGAYEQLVDELLASPHFGERWAQHWLDVIRWAESNGSEANLYRKNAWVYRDYVVRAFNGDVPYDQFIREQIAGDSLGSGDATGFLVAGPHVPAATVGREPAAIRQARADRMDEIMQTVGASIMGVTIGCARCHNHKFDPISIQDYYSLTAVFQDIEFGSRFPEFSENHPRRERGQELWREIGELRRELRQTGGWEEDWGAFRETHFGAVEARAIRIRFKMPNVGLDELEVFGPADRSVNLVRAGDGVTLSGFPEKGVDDRNPIDRVNDGEYGTMTWRGSVPKDAEEKPWVQFDFVEPVKIDRIRMSANREYFYDTDYLDKKPYLPRYQFELEVQAADGSWKTWLSTGHINNTLNQKFPERKAQLKKVQTLIETLAEEGPRPSFVGRLIRPDVTHVLLRGSPEDPRDEVMPAGPEILNGDLGLSSKTDGAKRRLEFARWISSAENPLTSRVMVNRIWHHVFGAGIVTTTSDFGVAGALPTHPELLDWLAAELVQPTASEAKPWSMKAMIRLLVLSDAFRRSSLPDEAALAQDGTSSLLWRYPPKRVAAEVIRDGILQASGKLDESLGGRSYRIHNEKKTYAQWEVVDNHGPHTWRRMLYQERMRRVDDQIFTAFDFPDCGQVRAKRPSSTTPLQALNLMNSEFVVEQSQFIADRALKETKGRGRDAAIKRCFELLLTREPRAVEMDVARQVAAVEGLNVVCRSLINANEFAFLP